MSMSLSVEHPTTIETKSLLPQHTRTRNNIHSPRKSISIRQHQPPDHINNIIPQPPPPHHRRCRILISTLFLSTTLLALLSLFAKFIIFPYLLPTPTPTLRILSLNLSLSPSHPNNTSFSSFLISLSNPTWASTFHFSDSAYTLHYNSKPISESNPNLRLQILPQETIEIANDMLIEKSDDTKRGMEEMMNMIYRSRRGDSVVVMLDMTVYLYGSSTIRPWSLRMVALFYDCVGIAVHFSAADGVGKSVGGAACQLVEKLTS